MNLPSLVTSLLLATCLAAGVSLTAIRDAACGKEFDAHAAHVSVFFKDTDMDFHLGNLVLGAATTGGTEIGEVFYAASGIVDGDAASWQDAWADMAGRVAARGEAALAAGHTVSAREQLLRAADYYRISLISMTPDNPELQGRATRSRELFRIAGKLLDPPMEYIEIPFEGTVLPGYFRAAPGKGPHKTLLMIGGGETFAEDLYFYIGPQAAQRGYNFITVDLPGQGLLPARGMVFRTDTFVPMRAVVDYVLSRPEVDPGRLAVYGISGGGLFAPQAAQHDPRIRAVAMNAAVVDAKALFDTMPAIRATPRDMASWSSFHAGVVASICWRFGVSPDDPGRLAEVNTGNTFEPARVAIPALILVGEGEYRSGEVHRQQHIALEGFPNPAKRLVVTPADEGAASHCIMENRSLMSQIVFDWLDEIFANR